MIAVYFPEKGDSLWYGRVLLMVYLPTTMAENDKRVRKKKSCSPFLLARYISRLEVTEREELSLSWPLFTAGANSTSS